MTREETQMLLGTISAVYSNFQPNDPTATINVWHKLFEEVKYFEAGEALKAYIETDKSGFAPTPAHIFEGIKVLKGNASLSGADAWSLVYKALTNSSYNSVEEFNKLPYPVQKAVGSADMLASWATVNIEEVQTVIQSQFLKSYAVEKERFEAIRTAPDKYEQLMDSRKPVEVPVIEEKKTIKIAEDDLDVIAHKILEKLKEDAKNE